MFEIVLLAAIVTSDMQWFGQPAGHWHTFEVVMPHRYESMEACNANLSKVENSVQGKDDKAVIRGSACREGKVRGI